MTTDPMSDWMRARATRPNGPTPIEQLQDQQATADAQIPTADGRTADEWLRSMTDRPKPTKRHTINAF